MSPQQRFRSIPGYNNAQDRSALGGRGIAVALMVVVSSACFALGFFVGKATTESKVVTEVITIPQEQPSVAGRGEEILRPVFGGAGVDKPEKEDTPSVGRVDPSGPDVLREAGGYSVQIGAYSDGLYAESIKMKYIRKGYKAYIVKGAENGRKAVYRVRVGDFQDKRDAKRMVLKLKRLEGVSAFITLDR